MAARPAEAPPVKAAREAAATNSGDTRETVDVDAGRAATPLDNGNPDETNVWPDAEAESAFLAEARERGESVRAPERQDEEPEPSRAELPPLDELVGRIPAETRELLDELFRAKFVAVRKVKKSDLKGPPAASG